MTQSFDVFFDLRLNKRLSKQSWGWWFETPSRPLWRHCNEFLLFQVKVWCRQTTSHYLNQYWPRCMSPYGVNDQFAIAIESITMYLVILQSNLECYGKINISEDVISNVPTHSHFINMSVSLGKYLKWHNPCYYIKINVQLLYRHKHAPKSLSLCTNHEVNLIDPSTAPLGWNEVQDWLCCELTEATIGNEISGPIQTNITEAVCRRVSYIKSEHAHTRI